jgi:signal transduction histidine kinase
MVETLTADAFPLDGLQVNRVAGVIDAAIASTVQAYVEARDHATETQHAQQVGFITHELRNPLTTAKIAVAQLRSQAGQAAGTTRLLDALERSIERLQRLVQDVLLGERLGSGELRSSPVDVTLGAIMDDALRVPQRDAQAKRIHVETRFDPDLLLHVDPTLAVTAVQNVVENAVKSTGEGSVQIEGEDRGGEAAIHVRDMCSGLTSEELETIFEPFRRGHAGKAQGTGIGLAIARRAVQALGGEITADSSENVGCHFCLTLPKSRH